MAARPLGRTVAEKAPILTDMAERYNLPVSAAKLRCDESDNRSQQAAKVVNASEGNKLFNTLLPKSGEGVGVKALLLLMTDC